MPDFHRSFVVRSISQMIRPVRRWLGKQKPFILVGDGGFAAGQLALDCIRYGVTLVSRLKMNASLFDFPPDPIMTPEQMIELYVDRWSIEVMFEEIREHLGVETQRQWSDKAIERSTPVLMGLYSLVCLMGNRLGQEELP